MFGYKVRAGNIDDQACCAIDLHVGNDPKIINRTVLAVIWIIEAYERDHPTCNYSLCEFIPNWSCWPVNQDRQCWDYLCRIAAETHVTQSGLTAVSYLRTTITSGQSPNWHNRYVY